MNLVRQVKDTRMSEPGADPETAFVSGEGASTGRIDQLVSDATRKHSRLPLAVFKPFIKSRYANRSRYNLCK